MEILLFLAGVFIITFALGQLMERVKIPWLFSSLLIGVGLAIHNPFQGVTASSSFQFLAQLGMYFLLFVIGFKLNIAKILKNKPFIIKTTLATVLLETLVGSLLFMFIFNLDFLISVLVAASFATVGESVLLPILKEYGLHTSKFGHTILGIGMLDDVIEVITIFVAAVIIGRAAGFTSWDIWINLVVLTFLFFFIVIIIRYQEHHAHFTYKDIPEFFLFVIFFIFLFVGVGNLVESAELGALLAGIGMRNIVPKKIEKIIDTEVKTIAYGFFGPIFFIWVGMDTNVAYLIDNYHILLFFILLIVAVKILSSMLVGIKELGRKKAILLGVSLCVKFSTSIVIIKVLFEKGVIPTNLYSLLVGATVLLKLIVPVFLAFYLKKVEI